MLNLRPIFLVNGTLLSILSVAMLIPAAVDLYMDNPDWMSFLISSFLTAFIGISLFLTNKEDSKTINLRQAFLLTGTCWVTLSAFSALPFFFSDLNISYTDAFFESMSGLTTTGATVLIGLDNMPPGVLLWRSLLAWLGGIGIIVMAMAVLPMLKIGGMQLFRTESSDKSDKILPRAAHISVAIGSVYLLFTFLCSTFLWFAGVTPFNAINHAMTTVATSGFSTHDASIAHYNSPLIEGIISVFMLASAIPYVLYIQIIHGHKSKSILDDSQVRWFLGIVVSSIFAIMMWLYLANNLDIESAFRYAAFNVISVITTTGFASDDYSVWGGFAVTVIFLLSVVGGCTGSTTGGIKVFRYQILYQTARTQIYQLIRPHSVIRPRFNDKPVSDNITSSVMSFFILFAFCFLVLAMILSLQGLDYISSMSAAASCLANLGPALGPLLGPSGTYTTISDISKWVLSFAMLVGRLEVFTVLVLFSPYFWKD
ncbi:TrkH family potassium uptake protein [Rickettsiales bacterium]|nr:TrkH family potassium uptake protein [Rickettsiales bacterium]